MTRTACVVNLGTPSAPSAKAVRAFLREFLGDPLVVGRDDLVWRLVLHGIILPLRPRTVARQYASIWTDGGSPLAAGTERIAAALRARLGPGWRVAHGYRYGAPSVERVVAEHAARDGEELVLVPLFPQRTASTTGTIERAAERAGGCGGNRGRVRLALLEPDDPGYVAALADRLRAALAELGGAPDHVVLSFHGLPVRCDRAEGGRYSADCRRTAAALAAALGLPADRFTLAYQSRFGREPWLEPSTAALLRELPARGARRVAVSCPGFLTDGLETLEELGVRGRESFESAGGERLALAPACGDHPALVAALSRLVSGGA